ncbi:hypothetical protein NDU88_006969 [Pleurodeles waltl]|uniref:Uncharacterized protein n=1 Tax=Pleurodeles waltl TaxID=8319 RepID=A0AAV7LTG2_PLEWA|nr:hypothetical protein NDU88_006969 [Pleurodeles waltl]
MVALLGYVSVAPAASLKLLAMTLLMAKRRVAMPGGHLAPRERNWLKDLTYCKERLDEYWALMPATARRHDTWAPRQCIPDDA